MSPDFLPLAAGNHGESLVLLLAALGLDFVLGILPGMARLIPEGGVFLRISSFFERRLNRPERSRAALVVRGALVVLLLLALGLVAGFLLAGFARALDYGWVIEFATLILVISGRRAFLNLRRGLSAVAEDDRGAGHRLVAEFTGRDPSRLDRHGVARIVVERGAVEFFRRVVAPSFWFVVLGLPGLLASRAVARLARLCLQRGPAARAFGAAALALDHTLALLPSWLAAYLLAGAALVVPQAYPRRALEIMSLDAGRDEVVNDGRLKGATAGALGLALGGPFGTKGGGVRDAWIGNGRARVGQGDIRRVLYLCAVAFLILLIAVAGLTLALL